MLARKTLIVVGWGQRELTTEQQIKERKIEKTGGKKVQRLEKRHRDS
jgi:hypothetical protein